MGVFKEDRNSYFSEVQREVLQRLIAHPTIEEKFFLTGGTALSVFYLSHRVSDDIDLFTLNPIELGEIDFWIKTQWPGACAKIKEGPEFLSLLIREVKVDFVVDPLSTDEEREVFLFENGKNLSIDTMRNIVSNKLCAVVSRTEPKDFVDFYMILQTYTDMKIGDIYLQSKLKDAVFDDPPTAAYQLEMGLSFVQENPSLLPKTSKQIDWQDFFGFYTNIVKWIYELIIAE